MNKKILSIIGAIALLMTFSSCSNNSKSSIVVDGKSYSVDKFLLEHYTETHVKQALKRADAQVNVVRPTDASSFGAKKAEVTWYAYEEDLKSDLFVNKVGTVTVVHYENGIEIIKDGQHWFYDGFTYTREWNMWSITASIAILDRSRWEPTRIRISDTGVDFDYLYMKDYNGFESWGMTSIAREKLGIKDSHDMISEYKKY
jgi:hypothetical protein